MQNAGDEHKRRCRQLRYGVAGEEAEMEQQGWVGLADAVRALRSELTAAMAEAEQARRAGLDAEETW